MNLYASRFSTTLTPLMRGLFTSLLLMCVYFPGAYAANQPAPATYMSDANGNDGHFGQCNIYYGQIGTAAENPFWACEFPLYVAAATADGWVIQGNAEWTLIDQTATSVVDSLVNGSVCTFEKSGVPLGCISSFINYECREGGKQVTQGGLTYPAYCLLPAETNYNTGCPTCAAKIGNPIDTASGNKYEAVTDYRGGGAFPLVFSRAYNSELTGLTVEKMGNAWSTNVGARLTLVTRGQLVLCQEPNSPHQYYGCPGGYVPGATPIEVTIWGADGSQSLFTYQYNTAPDGTQLVTEQTSTGQLFFMATLPAPATGGGFRYLRADGYTEYFTSAGQLVAVQNPSGLQQTYQYTAGQLTRITDPFTHYLAFTYYPSGNIQTVATPSGTFTYSYDSHNNLSTVHFADNNPANLDDSTLTYVYGNTSFPNALTGIIDEKGNPYVTWGYDTQGRAVSSQHAGGVDSFSTVYTTDGAGNVSSAQVTEPQAIGQPVLTRTLNFTTINFMTLLTSVSDPCTECGDKTAAMTYDSSGYVQRKTDFDGNVTQYVHDSFGNETSRIEASNSVQDARTINTTWNYSVNQPSLITEPEAGRTTAYTYNSVGQVLTKTVTDTVTGTARPTTYTYNTTGNGIGLLAMVTDPMNHVTSYGYDAQGNLSTITNTLNQPPIQITYDANGMPSTIIDPNYVETDLTYDGRQRLKTRTVAGALTTFDYDLVGNLVKVTLPTGSYLTYSYDAAYRLTGIQDSACVSGVCDSIAYTLDNLGNRHIEQTYDPNGVLKKSLQRNYNDLNQLISLVGGAGQTTQYTVDRMGNTTSIQDPMTNVTNQVFDALNRLVTVEDPATVENPVNGNTNYNYDPLDRVNDVTDAKGVNTGYSYDAFGDVTQQVSKDTGTTTYTYDLDGNRLSKTDARGVTAYYSYDDLNRLTGITYPDPSRDVTYTYDQGTDGIGHLYSIQDATGTTAYQYDAHGNTTHKAVTLGTHTFNVGYQYDTADNLTGMTYPDGMQVNYGRDTAERIASVSETPQGGITQPIASSVTYRPFGPMTGFTYGNGLIETRSYDQDYRLTGISVPGVLDWTLTPNADDDITNITDNINSANSQALGYDTLNRLTSASGGYGNQSYQYANLDGLDGNRTQEILGSVTTALTYDTVSNKLLTVGSQGYQYDAVGNLTNDGTQYYYDAANRLTGYGSTPTAYLYNGLGQRSVKNPTASDVAATANNGSLATDADTAGNGMLSATPGYSGQIMTFVMAAAPSHGTVTISNSGTGAFIYTPATGYAGADSFTFQVTDSYGDVSNTATESITVNDVVATANNGNLTTNANTAGNGTLSATLGYTGQILTFALGTAPTHGSVTITNTATGTFTYTPVTGYAGADSFTFNTTDEDNTISNTATENVTVTDVVATADNGNVSTNAGVPGNGTLYATLGYTGQTLTFAMVTGPTHGTVTITNAATGAFTYTPATGYSGSDSFTFTATDADSTVSNTASESVTVNDVAATANANSVNGITNTTVSGNLSATLGYTGQTLTYAIVMSAAHGTVSITNAATGAFTYTPTTGYTGADSFTFTATDQYSTVSNTATESVTVNDIAATANVGSVNTTPATAVNGTLSATLGYTGQTLTFVMVANPSHGTVSITNAATGAFTYTPTAGYTGSDTFRFKATDGYGTASNTANETAFITGPVASLTPSSFDFGSTLLRTTSSTETFTLQNIGNALLSSITIVKAGTNSDQFNISNSCGGSLAAGASCNIDVTFSPTAAGPMSALIQVKQAGTVTQQSTFTGTGATALPSLSPTSLNFGNVVVHHTSTMTASLTNNGTGTLTISSVFKSGGDFGQSNNCGTTLAAGTSCTFTVTYTPSVTSAETGSVTIVDNPTSGGANNQTISLSGHGTN